MITPADWIHYASLILPFANETAIVLTHSKLPLFKGLYRGCIDDGLIHDTSIKKKIESSFCTGRDYLHKVLIDLLAYLGIILFIGKNTLTYGYATGVVTGMVLIFCSIMLPNMFLGVSIHKITQFLAVQNPYIYIAIGIALIIALIYLTSFLEDIAQKLTKAIIIDPEAEKHTL